MTTPLATLAHHIATDGAPPLAWLVEHCPDGNLQRLWDECEDPQAMIALEPCARLVVSPEYLGLSMERQEWRASMPLVPIAGRLLSAVIEGRSTMAEATAAAMRETVRLTECVLRMADMAPDESQRIGKGSREQKLADMFAVKPVTRGKCLGVVRDRDNRREHSHPLSFKCPVDSTGFRGHRIPARLTAPEALLRTDPLNERLVKVL